MSFFPHRYPINILSKSCLLNYSIFQIFAAFSQKCALAFHFRGWLENKRNFLLPLIKKPTAFIYLPNFGARPVMKFSFLSVTLGASSLSITFLLLRCLCLLSSHALCSDTSRCSEFLFLGNSRYIYTSFPHLHSFVLFVLFGWRRRQGRDQKCGDGGKVKLWLL